jgi:beta-galactosidase
MLKNFGPFSPKVKNLLHGGDYNPDQWLDSPEILKEDLRLMKLARCNAATVGIFAWTALEPEEGRFNFGWLDKIMDELHQNGVQVILATPSGAKPAWMAKKYPEIRRVDRNGIRQAYKGRHNNCYSSPVYREKTAGLNSKLAERYGKHPALILWHVSNEYNHGECHCENCYARFRGWLKKKFGTLEQLNQACWNAFWSHTYTDWDQVEAKDEENIGMELLWRKFTTDLCVDFFKSEAAPLRKISPAIPITTNFMSATYSGLDYSKIAEEEDVVSWDSYPVWHKGDDFREASLTAFSHDAMRAMKGGKPFLLMESTTEGTNWMEVSKSKKPGMNLPSTLQAIAHGADSGLYFQWRKGRGGSEQFHGAVVDHAGHEGTRVFKDVARTGEVLEKLTPVLGTTVDAEVALIWDWETRWAIEYAKGPRNRQKNEEQDAQEHYFQFWKRGIPVDPVCAKKDISKYKAVIAPYMFVLDKEFAERIEAFVSAGGVFITTYLAATVDSNGLCHLGGRPGLIRKVLGIWAEEVDALWDQDRQEIAGLKGNVLGLKGPYPARHYADIVHLEGAKALAHYKNDWYAKSPAVTLNRYGKGKAYYLASRNSEDFLSDFYAGLVKDLGLRRILSGRIPEGVEVAERSDEKSRFVFLTNFRPSTKTVPLGILKGVDLLTGRKVSGKLRLGPYEAAVIRKP